jgi:hypothetical protein
MSKRAQVSDPSEWIEIAHVAVRTRSVLVAARVARQVKRTRQHGKVDGVEYLCLARFRECVR